MALTKQQKKTQVASLTQKMGEAKSMVFAHYIGLSVADISELRSKLKEGEAEMKVAKKTLIKIASKEAGLPDLEQAELDGPVSIIFSYQDAISGAQIAFKFAKDHDQVALIGGIFDGKVLSKQEAIELAKMPSREELLATFVGMIQSPTTRFAMLCSSPMSSFARALSQMAEKGGFAEVEAPTEEAPATENKTEAAAEKASAEENKEEIPDTASESSDDESAKDESPEASSDTAAEDAKADEADTKQDA